MQFNTYEEQEEYYRKMDEYKKHREQREDVMTFLEFLETKLSEVKELYHRKKFNSTYDKACYIMQRINSRFHKEDDGRHLSGSALPEKTHLELTSQKLNSYKSSLSDTRKSDIINDFRSNLIQDLEGMVRSREISNDPISEH